MIVPDGFECVIIHTSRKSGWDELEAVREARRVARKRGKQFFVVANIENRVFLTRAADLAELFDAIDSIQDSLISAGYAKTIAKVFVDQGIMQKTILATLAARGGIDYARKLH
jgi:hypothetical protein